jgi:hypothetical protein
MEIHRSIATSFEKPSIDMSLDMRLVFTAQSQKTLLNAVSRSLDIPKQPHGIGQQWPLQPLKGRMQPSEFVVAPVVARNDISRLCWILHHVGQSGTSISESNFIARVFQL